MKHNKRETQRKTFKYIKKYRVASEPGKPGKPGKAWNTKCSPGKPGKPVEINEKPGNSPEFFQKLSWKSLFLISFVSLYFAFWYSVF